jgi:hypothetical protein
MKQHTPPEAEIRELESLLDQEITRLIARDLKVKPEEITPEFIQKWRDDHLYPVANVDLTTLYGGYNAAGRRVLTCAEVKSDREQADRFFSRF